MDENDATSEKPTKDADDVAEGHGLEVTSDTRDIDFSEEEGFPPHDPLEMPVNAATPFEHTPEHIYVYDGAEPTSHQVLGLIEPGENRFPTDEAVMVAALEACCATGLLRQMPPQPGPQADEDDKMPEDEPV